jgi:2-methylcitrate dehydratase PrpD
VTHPLPGDDDMLDFAVDYGEFASALNVATLPSEVQDAVRTNLFDTLACAVAGRGAPGARELSELVCGWGGKPEASVLWSDVRVPAHHAAWINGVTAHARDYDDTHDGAILHAGVSVIPAALAAAELSERPVSGADLFAGIVAGAELICRLGIATRIGIIDAGFIFSGLFGHFAATAAASRVLGFDGPGTANAIGIAYSQAAGTHQVTRDGALTKRMQPGFAAKTGLLSVALAQTGINGARDVFEGYDGLSRTYLQGELDSAELRAGLGQRFHMTELSYKPYPCCRFNHTAMDAALQIRNQAGFEADAVTAVRVGCNRQAWEAVATPIAVRKAPQTVVQAQFSICYTIACALQQGSLGLSDFTEEALQRPEIRRLSALVEPSIDEDIEREWGRNISPCAVEVETSGGVYRARVDLPRGNRERMMSDAEFDAKLDDCLTFSKFSESNLTTDRFRQLLAAMETAPDVRPLIGRLARLEW